MQLVGRKRYHAWSDDLVVGLGVITDRWEGFVPAAPRVGIVALYDLCGFDGEITAFHIGQAAKSMYGHAVNQLVTDNGGWTPADGAWKPRAGFCGRRLIAVMSDTAMVVIDKIVGPPSVFGISPEKGNSAVVHDIYVSGGEFIEKLVGRPAEEAFGRDANAVFDEHLWLAEGEDLGHDPFRDHAPSQALGSPRGP